MENNGSVNVGIKNSWSLINFAKSHGKPQLATGLVNQKTGEVFDSCVFTDADGARTFVSFSSNLGTLSVAEIVAQKDALQVVELMSGNYKLCKQGDNSWQDIDLF